jgi:hypothetical protein
LLLVEDEEPVRLMTRHVLEHKGYRVVEAPEGETALELARHHAGPIHLLVTDVVMPRLNGPQLWERLRALRPSLKVLFMSGYTDEFFGEHGLSALGAKLLHKPFTPDSLVRQVRETLDAPP